MSDERAGGADEDAGGGHGAAPVDEASEVTDAATAAAGSPDGDDEAAAGRIDDASPAAEIVSLDWDDDLPVALGEETEPAAEVPSGQGGDDGTEDGADGEVESLDWDEDPLSDSRVARRRNALPRRVESWRSRSASGAIVTAIAMGLQQVFEPEKRRPAAVAEAPSDPYSDDDPITVDYVPDDAEATTVHVKPWLLQKGDPT